MLVKYHYFNISIYLEAKKKLYINKNNNINKKDLDLGKRSSDTQNDTQKYTLIIRVLT